MGNVYKSGCYHTRPIQWIGQSRDGVFRPYKVADVEHDAAVLESVLKRIGVPDAKVENISQGLSVTVFKVSLKSASTDIYNFDALETCIAAHMNAKSVRIVDPRNARLEIWIEISNENRNILYLGDVANDPGFSHSAPLDICAGEDVFGRLVNIDIARLPHLLIAGSSGTGKTAFINSMLVNILCKESPANVKMVLFGPKVVEYEAYNELPHLLMPVITDGKTAVGALKWAVSESKRRCELIDKRGVSDINGYNSFVDVETLPLILIVIDELLDLMMIARDDVEKQIMELIPMARKAGIHLVISTQRPTKDVITDAIDKSITGRIAFAVMNKNDSEVILHRNGAEKLLGQGDMLYFSMLSPRPVRIQGAFVTEHNIVSVTNHIKTHNNGGYDESVVEAVDGFVKEIITCRNSGFDDGFL